MEAVVRVHSGKNSHFSAHKKIQEFFGVKILKLSIFGAKIKKSTIFWSQNLKIKQFFGGKF